MQNDTRTSGSSRETSPLVIQGRDGTVITVLACNRKSRTKSLEQGELWVVWPETGRVLPWRDGSVKCGEFVRHDPGNDERPWYEVGVDALPMERSSAHATAPDTGKTGPIVGRTGETTSGHRIDHDVKSESVTDRTVQEQAILKELADVIAERRRTMPEGSYTTHLFSRGAAKIRKKTGEEAVELILAESRDEIVAEAADLIYHTIVLLEQEGIRIEEILQELAHRHGT